MFSVYGECRVNVGVVDFETTTPCLSHYLCILVCMTIYNFCTSLFENKRFTLYLGYSCCSTLHRRLSNVVLTNCEHLTAVKFILLNRRNQFHNGALILAQFES